MTAEVGVTESVKKKLARSTIHGLVRWKEWEMKNWQREQMFRKWRGNGDEENLNCDGGLH